MCYTLYCMGDGPPKLLHQFWRWHLLTQQYAPDLVSEDLSLTHVLLETSLSSSSLLYATHFCHHTLPAFCDECQLVDILQLLETVSPLDVPIWTDSVSHQPCFQRSAEETMRRRIMKFCKLDGWYVLFTSKVTSSYASCVCSLGAV